MSKIALFQQPDERGRLSEQAAQAAVKSWVQEESQPGWGQGIRCNKTQPVTLKVMHLKYRI